ncbi:MAG TPA: hypothetical protein VLE23_05725 [Geminicoccaceae bacterium]|nr:hypothetical protein [Geminicoccaceae bacterium]
MQPVTLPPRAPRPAARQRLLRLVGVAAAATCGLAAATALLGGTTNVASAACPWIVQPAGQNMPISAEAPPAFDIVFDGLEEKSKVFYGFTVASLDLAWQLANERVLPALASDGRRLEVALTPHGTTAYLLSPDSIQPHTIYLVAAGSLVRELEQIDARIEPARPLALSQLMPRTRGGSDWSGPLPHRSLPGFEIAGANDQAGPALADVQICAYQVAMR